MTTSETTTTRTTTTTMKSPISPRLLSSLFTSLSSSKNPPTPRQWHLHRILRSDNPTEINGELNGIATFHPLLQQPQQQPQNTPSSDDRNSVTLTPAYRQMVYKEEGEMPSSVMGMAGIKWTKKYIWRLNGIDESTEPAAQQEEENPEMGGISVWFVKIKSSSSSSPSGKEPGQEENQDDEPDYLFHEFDFNYQLSQNDATKPKFDAPTPPPLIIPALRDRYPETMVIQATGDHLCVKDMYYTAYSFRVVPETGEVLSWASRHVVKGPKKNQDILNFYSIQ